MQDTRTDRSGLYLIVNEKAGSQQQGQYRDRLERWLSDLAGPARLRVIGRNDDIRTCAREAAAAGYGTVVAAGGDGTVCAVAEALADSGAALGVVPLGTFNFFARGIGVPLDVDAALEALALGRKVPVTTGDLNGRIFLNNASIGLYPAILSQREGIYRRWGRNKLVSHWSVLKALFGAPNSHRMRVSVDGAVHEVRTPLAFVANSAFQLEQYQLAGAEPVRAGQFALFLAANGGRWRMLLFALRLARGKMMKNRDFTLLCGDEIVIETRKSSRLVARDGESERMQPPFRFTHRRDALQVVMPNPREVTS